MREHALTGRCGPEDNSDNIMRLKTQREKVKFGVFVCFSVSWWGSLITNCFYKHIIWKAASSAFSDLHISFVVSL